MSAARMRTATLLLAVSVAAVPAVLMPAASARAQPETDPRPPVVDTRGDRPPTPEEAAEIADLEERKHAAEGRASAFAALTIGGTTLLVGGVVAMVVVALIDPAGCTGMDCVAPVEDFAAGISLSLVGIAAVLIGGILWGDADASAAALGRRINELQNSVEPTFSLGPDGFRAGLRGTF